MGVTRDQLRRIAHRTGYPVVEAWSGHNKGQMGTVKGALVHHTGSSWAAKGDYPTLKVVRDGRPGLENSLCAFGLGKSGTIYLISEKLSWHAGNGEWNGLTNGNGQLLGIEAESDGVHWTPEEIDAYPRLVASILYEIGMDDRYTTRHASFALPRGRKVDTSGLDMDAFWNKVYFYLDHPEYIDRNYKPNLDEVQALKEEEKDMTVLITAAGKSDVYGDRVPAISSGDSFIGLGSDAEKANARAALPEIWVEPYTWDALAADAQLARQAKQAAINTAALQSQILAAMTANVGQTNPPA